MDDTSAFVQLYEKQRAHKGRCLCLVIVLQFSLAELATLSLN